MRALNDGTPIAVRNPSAVRPWQHVLEPLSGYLTLAAQIDAALDSSAPAAAFTPGSTTVPYAGRVFTEDEVEAAVSSTLDFWLTLGPEGDAFERELAWEQIRPVIGTDHVKAPRALGCGPWSAPPIASCSAARDPQEQGLCPPSAERNYHLT